LLTDKGYRSPLWRIVEANCTQCEDEPLTTLHLFALTKNIFLLFFGTPCDVASAQRVLKKRF
jgi:hypothetical protein